MCIVRISSTVVELTSLVSASHIRAEELYHKLRAYLSRHLERVVHDCKAHADEALLAFYAQTWTRYSQAAQSVSRIFRFMHGSVLSAHRESDMNVHDIYTLFLVQWQTVVCDRISEDLTLAISDAVITQRKGGTIDQDTIKVVLNSFVDVSVDINTFTLKSEVPARPNLDYLRFHFERPFLDATRAFYQTESRQLLAELSMVQYMKKVETLLGEEIERTGTYLPADMTIPLRRVTHQTLIEDHARSLRAGFRSLLDNEREEDMARMADLLSHVPDALDPLWQDFEAHLRKAGLAALVETPWSVGTPMSGAMHAPVRGSIRITTVDKPGSASRNEDSEADGGPAEGRPADAGRDGAEIASNDVVVCEDWIARGGRDLLWLPPDYRVTCGLRWDDTVVLGHTSGQLTFWRFHDQRPLVPHSMAVGKRVGL